MLSVFWTRLIPIRVETVGSDLQIRIVDLG